MTIFVLSFRDEFRPEPRQLVAYRDRSYAGRSRDTLEAVYRDLVKSREAQDVVNQRWTEGLLSEGVPVERHFQIDLIRHTNVAFEVKELVLVE